jgi:antitoxin PrlF
LPLSPTGITCTDFGPERRVSEMNRRAGPLVPLAWRRLWSIWNSRSCACVYSTAKYASLPSWRVRVVSVRSGDLGCCKTLLRKIPTMRITSKGQVTIPIEIRNRLGLLPGTEVEFDVDRDAVRLVRAKNGRGRTIVGGLRGRASGGLSTEEIMALTRE